MHDIAHPQLPGLGEGEAAPVGVRLFAPGLVHQAMAGEQAVDRRQRQGEILRDLLAGACLADEQLHRKLGVTLLDLQQHVDDLRGQRTRLAAVGARLGQERIEAPASIQFQPVAQRLGGHPGGGAPGDGVRAGGLLLDQRIQPLRARFQAPQIGDEAVTKQRHRMAVVGIGVFHRQHSSAE